MTPLRKEWILIAPVLALGCGADAPPPEVGQNTQAQLFGGCAFPALTQPEGWTYSIPITTSAGPAGVAVDCGPITQWIGVVNDGPGSPPKAPPTVSVGMSGIDIWDLTDGSVVTSGNMNTREGQGFPFANGCYRFFGTASAMRTFQPVSGHNYQIECRVEFLVTRYKDVNGKAEIDSVRSLAFGFGSSGYYAEPEGGVSTAETTDSVDSEVLGGSLQRNGL